MASAMPFLPKRTVLRTRTASQRMRLASILCTVGPDLERWLQYLYSYRLSLFWDMFFVAFGRVQLVVHQHVQTDWKRYPTSHGTSSRPAKGSLQLWTKCAWTEKKKLNTVWTLNHIQIQVHFTLLHQEFPLISCPKQAANHVQLVPSTSTLYNIVQYCTTFWILLVT